MLGISAGSDAFQIPLWLDSGLQPKSRGQEVVGVDLDMKEVCELRAIFLVGQQDKDPISGLKWGLSRVTIEHPTCTLNNALLFLILTVTHVVLCVRICHHGFG